MILRTILALFILVGTIQSSYAAQKHKLLTFSYIKGWKVYSRHKASSKLALSCVAVKTNSYGENLFISYSSGIGWSVSLFGKEVISRRPRSRNGKMKVVVDVDGSPIFRGRVKFSKTGVLIPFETDEKTLIALKQGSNITFAGPKGSIRLPLSGSHAAIGKVIDCWKLRMASAPYIGKKKKVPFGDSIAGIKRTKSIALKILRSIGEPFELIPKNRGLFKNYHVNWRFETGGLGGMRIDSSIERITGKQILNALLFNSQKSCSKAAIQRSPLKLSATGTTRYHANLICSYKKSGDEIWHYDFWVLDGPNNATAIYNAVFYSNDLNQKYTAIRAEKYMRATHEIMEMKAKHRHDHVISEKRSRVPRSSFQKSSVSAHNNKLLTSTRLVRQRRKSSAIAPLEIKTATGGDYYVKIVDARSNREEVVAYIVGGDSFKLKIPLGEFLLRYAAGKRWKGEEEFFGNETVYSEAEKNFIFKRDGNKVTGYRVELILQQGGNLRTKRIRRTGF